SEPGQPDGPRDPGSPSDPGAGDEDLAATGGSPMPLLVSGAAVILLLGAVAVVIAMRRVRHLQ
ncbi:hypothetical protein NHL53_07935, partial [Microbacterium sp. gxy059]